MKQGVLKKGFDLIIKGSKIKMDPPNFENLEYKNDTQNGIAVPNSPQVVKAETKIATRFLNIKKYVHPYNSF